MVLSQLHIDATTPSGARLVPGGATFRVWAPGAQDVYVAVGGADDYRPRQEDRLEHHDDGEWTGFLAGMTDGSLYRFFVVGPGGSGFKRDPWARELELHDFSHQDCVIRADEAYPWHDADFRPPPFEDLVVYQFHVGVFTASSRGQESSATFLDALDRVEYLADLGVTAIQPLPFVEFRGEWSLGYNGTDLFSPEMDYCVDAHDLAPHLSRVNDLLGKRGRKPITAAQLSGQVNQLKAFVDVFHVFGIAVIADVVYNHAGGNLDPESIDYFDFPADRGPGSNLYFSEAQLAGGRVFAFDRAGVRKFLIGNALMFLQDYHVDGLRFDEVTVIDANGGWSFCQELTSALKAAAPAAALIAEYWGEHRWLAVQEVPGGMGFDLGYADGLRDAVRGALEQATHGASAPVSLEAIRSGLERPWKVPRAWQAYNCLENHDLVLDADGDHRRPRIARLADSNDPRSWYARSRARVATGLLLTAPGTPMLFMGQEFLEDKLWSDNPHHGDLRIWWDGLTAEDPSMRDHRLFTHDLIRLRRSQPALRSDPVHVYLVDDASRVVAFHRWVPDVGQDVVVVASLSESSFENGSYRLGMPIPGDWFEVLNSDVYDRFPNPVTRGNGGHVVAFPEPMHGLPASAGLTIPANGLLVLARQPDGR
jgi:1,4-alpha-glucan branching enzyme